jgi:hypothetical protein
VTNLDPLDRLQLTPAAHWAHGGLGGVKVRPYSPSDRAAGLCQNAFCSVFELPSLRNTRKREKKDKRGKPDIEIVTDLFGKILTCTFCNYCFIFFFFEHPSLRNAQKRTKNKVKNKKSAGGWVWDLANARGGSVGFVFRGPS